MHQSENTAIIVAAGNGTRFNTEIPKQFLRLEGREVLSYSVKSFFTHGLIHEVIIVTSREYLERVRHGYPHCQVVEGGATRQDSVFNGLQACAANTQHVLIHDAARPLVPGRILDDCFTSLEDHDGVAPALASSDSMVILDNTGFSNLSREHLKIVQTPQCFHIDILKRAHASGKVDTDEMGLVKQAIPEARLTFVDGAPESMKITHKMDLEIAAIHLRSMLT